MTESISPFYSKLNKCANDFCTTLATIELTNRCNAQCGYCYIHKNPARPELSTLQIHQIIDRLNNESILIVNITGGEIFLRDDILEILEHLFESNFFYISIFTNGTVIKDNHISLLEKYHNKIYPFRMTVYSHHESIHDQYMKVPGSLQTIITNGKKLLQCGVKVKLAIPVLNENFETIAESIQFFSNMGFTTGLNLVKVVTNSNNSEAITNLYAEDFYLKFIENLQKKNIVLNFPSGRENNKLCRGIKSSIMIDTNGDIHPCTAFRNLVIGSIFEQLPLSEILKKSPEYNRLRSLSKDDLYCSKCDLYGKCSPCLARHHTLTNSLSGPYPSSCNLTKAIYRSKITE